MASTRTHSRRSNQSFTDRSRLSSGDDRSQSQSYKDQSEAYSSDYSDDFEAETKSAGAASARTDVPKRLRGKTRSLFTSDRSTIGLHSSATSQRSYNVYGNLRKKKQAKSRWKSNSAPRTRSVQAPKKSQVASQMLTAKQQELNDLQSKLFFAKQKLETADKENKLLKTLQHRQDKAIRKFENAENDLPRLISQNFEDQRILKARLRKTLETKRALESKLSENNEEMQKIEGVLRRLKKLVYDKNLGERSELSKQLTETESNLSVAEGKIKELGKKLELATASYTRQLQTERLKHRQTREKMEKLDEDFMTMDAKLKEKERALNVSNIYAMRRRGSPEKALALVASSPKTNQSTSSTQTNFALTLHSEVQRSNSPEGSKDAEEGRGISPSLNRLHSDTSRTAIKQEKKNVKTSVFLTADFDSPLSSPTSSFIKEVKATKVPKPTELTDRNLDVSPEREDLFSNDLKKTEEEIKKLQIALKQKADLLSKIQAVDGEKSNPASPVLFKPSSAEDIPRPTAFASKLNSKAELVHSVLSDDKSTSDLEFLKPDLVQPTKPPMKPEREISFGSYAPTVGGVVRRKTPLDNGKSLKKTETPTFEIDEPIFDLTSGKQNKKSDLLTQLFGNKDALLVSNSTSLKQ